MVTEKISDVPAKEETKIYEHLLQLRFSQSLADRVLLALCRSFITGSLMTTCRPDGHRPPGGVWPFPVDLARVLERKCGKVRMQKKLWRRRPETFFVNRTWPYFMEQEVFPLHEVPFRLQTGIIENNQRGELLCWLICIFIQRFQTEFIPQRLWTRRGNRNAHHCHYDHDNIQAFEPANSISRKSIIPWKLLREWR